MFRVVTTALKFLSLRQCRGDRSPFNCLVVCWPVISGGSASDPKLCFAFGVSP